jgi:hypothetical protein
VALDERLLFAPGDIPVGKVRPAAVALSLQEIKTAESTDVETSIAAHSRVLIVRGDGIRKMLSERAVRHPRLPPFDRLGR